MKRHRIRTRIPFCVMKALAMLFQKLGHRQALFLGEKVGDFFRIILKSKTIRMRENLEMAYPVFKGTPMIRRLERDVFRHYGKLGAEFLRFPVLSEEWLKNHVELEGVDHVQNMLEQGNGVLSFIAHFGNWELISKRLSLDLDTPIHVVTRKIRDPNIDAFIRAHRARYGKALSISAEEEGIRAILKALKKNEIVVMALDQSTGPPEGIFSPFFGRLAGTHPGAARIAMKLRLPLLPAFDARVSSTDHRVSLGPPLCFSDCPDAGLPIPSKIQWLTDRCTALIEERIREYPEQWIWMHNRWKSHLPEAGSSISHKLWSP